jgi:Fur family ferric uptake transcriptional regulator
MPSAAADLLRSAGLRRTPTRIAVLACIESVARPVSHAELRAMPALVDVDTITLYRTLRALEEVGLVHSVFGIDRAWRYCAQPRERTGCPGNHAHFSCTACGSMTCLVAQPMPRTEVPEGAEVDGRFFLLHGRCASCVAAARPASSSSGDAA